MRIERVVAKGVLSPYAPIDRAYRPKNFAVFQVFPNYDIGTYI